MSPDAKDHVAHVSTSVRASQADVWRALVDPGQIKRYMFGTDVSTDWEVGGEIVWEGEWQGKPYRDKGRILRKEPGRLLRYSHFSPLTGKPDRPENYHTVTIELSGDAEETTVSLTQDNNESDEARRHSERNWQAMLDGLKETIES